MATLSIKNVPDDVVARLRARARANHRSLQGELLHLAHRAAEGAEAFELDDRHQRNEPRGRRSIEQIAAERRQRRPEPVADAPPTVDLIRHERDAR